jgi:hypothetical protein
MKSAQSDTYVITFLYLYFIIKIVNTRTCSLFIVTQMVEALISNVLRSGMLSTS